MIPRKSSCKGTIILLVWCWKDLGSNPNSAIYCSVKVTQSCSTLCDPTDYTVHGILQTRILEWVAFPFSRGSSQPRDRTQVSCIAAGFFIVSATREAQVSFYSLFSQPLWFCWPLFMWSTGEGNGKPLQYSCLENAMNSMKRQKDRTLKDELPRSVGAQYATGDQWRKNSRKNRRDGAKGKTTTSCGWDWW